VLFEAGRAAMSEKNYEKACAKFEESQRLDPAPGTLLNLGNCEERIGRVASAWERYRGAITELAAGDNRHDFAQYKITELKDKVPHLTVTLREGAPKNTQVWRNDTPISGSLNVELPLNPGKYSIVVEAPGFKTQLVAVELALGERKTIQVGPGEKLPPGSNQTSGAAGRGRGADGDGLSQTTWGYVVGGVGVAGLGTALAMGTVAWVKKGEAADNCDPNATDSTKNKACSEANTAGKTAATAADIASILGGVALGVGAYLVLTDTDDAVALEAGNFRHYSGIRFRGVF
jgi:hypothetical protein